MKNSFLTLIAIGLLAGAAHAGDAVETYTAVLSERDHFNSQGERLTSPAAIIRQDRANFHKFGKRDPGDESDGYFSSVKNREALEYLIERGTMSSAVRRMIVNGTPVVIVSVFHGSSGDYADVTVAE